MNVLLLDNTLDRDSWGSADLVRSIAFSADATIWVRRPPNDDFPSSAALRKFDRIVLSGSRTTATDSLPWTQKLDELIRQALNDKLPLLGVCYGHQALGRVLGGANSSVLNVRRSNTPEIGWTEIHQVSPPKAKPLFRGLPERFFSFSVHYDEVSELPQGTSLLARSDRCSIQAFSVDELPAFGIQFHPERDLEAGERTLKESLRKKLPFPLLNPGGGTRLYSADVGRLIFGNFMKGCW